MLLTLTQNAQGHRRLYLGGKSSCDFWLEPTENGGWSVQSDSSVAGQAFTPEQRAEMASFALTRLANLLGTTVPELRNMPFDDLAQHHTADPFASRRVPLGRRKLPDNAFVPLSPTVKSVPEFDGVAFTAARRPMSF